MSRFNINEHVNDFLVIPLGGTNEIGMNITLYHYLGKWLIVDCGTCFTSEFPGVRMLFPDIKFILPHKNNVLGLIITHCHEDHIGGVYYLWEQIRCPIFSTNFTINFLLNKFPELNKYQNIFTLNTESKLSLNPFDIELATLTHSTIEMQSVMINTKGGRVLHTGDWKFDLAPVVGPISNTESLKSFAQKGVLALVCDSTNAASNGKSESELNLQKSLISIIKKQKNLVVVTTFASSFARLYSLLIAARQANRKVVLSGKSMHRILEAAKHTGYFVDEEGNELAEIISEKQINQYSRSQILVIAAGCQGDENSALSSIASGRGLVKLRENDAVIFSSRMIPGNEKAILKLINKLALKKVEVITSMDAFVHISGHPFADDLEKMYEIIKPKFSIPVHGEPLQLYKHAKLASSFGVSKAIVPNNGAVIKLDKNDTSIIGQVHSGYIALDGKNFIHLSSKILKVRKEIATDGAIIVTIFTDPQKKKTMKFPCISTPGCLDKEENKKLIRKLKDDISFIITNNFSASDLSHKISSYLRKIVKAEISKKPYIEVNIEHVSL